MKKTIKFATPMEKPAITVGLDLGDRFSQYCMLNRDGEVIETGRIQTTEAALRRHFEGEPQMRVALECGTHSAWISRMLEQLGHQVLVANTRKIRAITASESKNDRNDAEKLARFAAHDPRLLSPICHRSAERQRDLDLVHARSTLVRARTMIVNALRGLVKSAGGRLPVCSTASFQTRVEASIPAALAAAAGADRSLEPEHRRDGPDDRTARRTLSGDRAIAQRARRRPGGRRNLCAHPGQQG